MLLDGINRRADARIIRIPIRQHGRNALQRLRAIGVGARQNVKGIRFDVGQRMVDFAQEHGEIHGRVGGLITVRGAVVTIHAIHASH